MAKVVADGLLASAIATYPQGFSHVVGTTSGDVTANCPKDADIATAEEDQADSVGFLADQIYIGGRTAVAFAGGAKTGTGDGFVARADAATGAIGDVRQFGAIGAATGPVELPTVEGGTSVPGALGQHRAMLTTSSIARSTGTMRRVG